METEEESVCCQELQKVWRRVESLNAANPGNLIECITQHPGFDGGCLNPWSLEIAYPHYRRQRDFIDPNGGNEQHE